MVLPTTSVATLSLIVLSSLLFCAWPVLYKSTVGRWRFEYFSLDCAFASLLFSLVVCFTLGVLGTGLPFNDRIVLVGRSTTLWGLGAGFLFGVGCLSLWGASYLLGIAAAMPLALSVALAVTLLFRVGVASWPLLGCGVVLFAISAVFAIRTARAKLPLNRSANFRRGRLMAIVSGLLMGGCLPLLRTVLDPDNGPGPYTALLGISVGLFLATMGVTFFSVNVPVIGAPPGLARYFQANFDSHVPGVLAGLAWTFGVYAVLLAANAAPGIDLSFALVFAVPFLSVLVGVWLAASRWKEFTGVPAVVRREWMVSALCFAAGVIVAAMTFRL